MNRFFITPLTFFRVTFCKLAFLGFLLHAHIILSTHTALAHEPESPPQPLVQSLASQREKISQVAKNFYTIDGLYEDNGVIKLWYTVLGLLDEYDKGLIAGFSIDFDKNGNYFTPEKGNNWWNYYFTHHTIGSPENSTIVRVPRYKRSLMRFGVACTMPTARAHYLLTTYMPLNSDMQKQLERIKAAYWPQESYVPTAQKTKVVGVYYQNPLLSEVQKAWSPQDLCDHVKQEIERMGACKILLFTEIPEVATAFEQNFSDNFEHVMGFGKRKSVPQERGAHELLSLFLLAQCDMVIAPGSYHSIGARIINPTLELLELDTFPYLIK